VKVRLAIAAAVLLLGGCTANDTTDKGEGLPEGQAPAKTIVVATYEGKDIFCVEQFVGYDNHTYSCDLVAHRKGEPIQVPKGMKRVDLTVIEMPYRGKKLKCITFRLVKGHPGYNCDYERFYEENKGALPPPNSPA
jgi:hypothetical protein